MKTFIRDVLEGVQFILTAVLSAFITLVVLLVIAGVAMHVFYSTVRALGL